MKSNEKCLLCGKSDANNPTLNLNEAFLTAYMMKKLAESFKNTDAFKLGIIDTNGNLIRKPVTLEEKLSYTSIDSYLTKVKKMLGSKTDLLNHNIYLEKVTDASKLPIELYEKELAFKHELSVIAKHFKQCLQDANSQHLPTELIEKIVLESFM